MIFRLLGYWVVAMVLEGRFRRFFPALRASLLLLGSAVTSGPLVSRARWRSRMRACNRCPVYNRATKQCRSGDLGCGCSAPMKFLFANQQCWARSEEYANLGWPENVQ